MPPPPLYATPQALLPLRYFIISLTCRCAPRRYDFHMPLPPAIAALDYFDFTLAYYARAMRFRRAASMIFRRLIRPYCASAPRCIFAMPLMREKMLLYYLLRHCHALTFLMFICRQRHYGWPPRHANAASIARLLAADMPPVITPLWLDATPISLYVTLTAR